MAFDPGKTGLDAQQVNYLRTARRRIRDNYSLSLAQNTHQKRGLRSQYARGKGDLRREFAQARMQLPGTFAERGLLNSGLYQRGLQRYGQESDAAFGNLRGQYNDEMKGLQLARTQLGSVKRAGLNDLAQEQAARRYALATSLRGVS